ncbi:hypothetical protein, partial [Pararobbsia alpina]|uniref:hypothetical protein n=1 Tax=Pararobbsia alpina TaxID=621374 RepID=UPI001C2E3E94
VWRNNIERCLLSEQIGCSDQVRFLPLGPSSRTGQRRRMINRVSRARRELIACLDLPIQSLGLATKLRA